MAGNTPSDDEIESPISNEEWIKFAFSDLPPGCAPVGTAFKENPKSLKDDPLLSNRLFRGVALTMRNRLEEANPLRARALSSYNTYIQVASFKLDAHNNIAGKKGPDTYGALHLLLIDDVLAKLQPKYYWPEPSLIVETSPNNEQWFYALSNPIHGHRQAKAFVNAFLKQAPNDGAGPVRWGRLPQGVNTKHPVPYIHRARLPNSGLIKFSTDDIILAFGLEVEEIPEYTTGEVDTDDPISKFRNETIVSWLKANNLIKHTFHNSIEIVCPLGDHDDGVGTRYWLPAEANDWLGGFSCMHDKCRRRNLGLRDLWAFVQWDLANN